MHCHFIMSWNDTVTGLENAADHHFINNSNINNFINNNRLLINAITCHFYLALYYVVVHYSPFLAIEYLVLMIFCKFHCTDSALYNDNKLNCLFKKKSTG